MWLSNGDFLNLDVLTTYNTHSIGNVEQCQVVKDWNPDAPFETQYCTLSYLALATTLRVGVCVPSSCSNADLKEVFGVIPALGKSAEFNCIFDYPWKTGAIVTLCLLCGFLLMVVIGTVYHLTCHRQIQASITETKANIEKMEKNLSEEKMTNSVKETQIELKASINGNSDWTGMMHLGKNGQTAHDNDGFIDVEGGLERTENVDPASNAPTYSASDIKGSKKKVIKMGFVDTLLMGFSALHNGAKVLNTEEAAGNLSVLNGIRVISMWWIILGHTFDIIPPYLDDPRYATTELFSSFWFSAVMYFSVSVDTFFFLSGLLLVYNTLKHLKKSNGRMNWALFYLHRFIRITPAYMICIAVFSTLIVHFNEGPGQIELFESSARICRERWWTNLLYINNLYPFPGSLGEQCVGWSWYLANDMQFFVISPVIIYLLYRYSKLGIGLIVALCLGSFGITAYLATYYGVSLGVSPPYNNNTVVVYGNAAADVIYMKPYCRIPPYLVGMVFGYIFYRLNGQPFKMNKWVNVIMWIAAVGAGLAIIYGPFRSDGEPLPQYAAVMYTTLSRAGFAVAVGWVTFSCVVGYGGPVNSFLSWSFWTPLSRINFCAYLLHTNLIYTFYSSAKSQYHFTYLMMASTVISNTVLSYAAAFILAIGVEGPVMGLEKALLGRRVGGKKK
ncbi:nose resistant to fluoxetine protein 6-like isoform X2 [Acanthaster planci]|nr:nose resistant to fluoxetine protein 6-like isoform X2 [Acanthaster planci]